MADPCVLNFAAPSGALRQGQSITLDVTVLNSQSIVDHITLEPLGELAQYATTATSVVQLLPGTTSVVPITFDLPLDAAVEAGPMPFALLARSGTDPSSTTVGETAIEIVGAGIVEAELRPVTSTGRRKAKHRVELTNSGNAPVRVRVSADDPDELLEFDVSPAQVTVPAGGSASVEVELTAGDRDPGNPRLPFTVRVTPGFDPEVQLAGAFRQKGGMPRWLVPVALAAVVLVAALIAFRPKTSTDTLSLAAAEKKAATEKAAEENKGDPEAAAKAAAAAGGDPEAAAKAAGGTPEEVAAAVAASGPAQAAGIAAGATPTTAAPATTAPAGTPTTAAKAAPAGTPSTTAAAVASPTTQATTATTAPHDETFYSVASTSTRSAASGTFIGEAVAAPSGTLVRATSVRCITRVTVPVTLPSTPVKGATYTFELYLRSSKGMELLTKQTGITTGRGGSGTIVFATNNVTWASGTALLVKVVGSAVSFGVGEDKSTSSNLEVSPAVKGGVSGDLAATMIKRSSC